MKYRNDAYRFIDQHVAQGDVLRTAAARISLASQMLDNRHYSNQTIKEHLADMRDALCLLDEEHRLVPVSKPPARL